MAKLRTLSEQTARETTETIARLRTMPLGSAALDLEQLTQTSPRVVRWGQTCVDDDYYTTYPTIDSGVFPNTYIVKLGQVDFTIKEPGKRTFSFTAYDPVEYRTAHDPQVYRYWPEDSIVRLELHHDEWYISEPSPPTLYGYTGADDIGAATVAGNGSARIITPTSGTVWLQYVDPADGGIKILLDGSSNPVEVTVWNNWLEPIEIYKDLILSWDSAWRLIVIAEACVADDVYF